MACTQNRNSDECAEPTPMHGPASSGPPEPGSFADGYQHGRDDLLYALAAGHQWAVDLLEAVKMTALGTRT